MCEALDLIPSTTNERGRERGRGNKRGIRAEGLEEKVLGDRQGEERRDDSCRCP